MIDEYRMKRERERERERETKKLSCRISQTPNDYYTTRILIFINGIFCWYLYNHSIGN
jgi:hypothetical protein